MKIHKFGYSDTCTQAASNRAVNDAIHRAFNRIGPPPHAQLGYMIESPQGIRFVKIKRPRLYAPWHRRKWQASKPRAFFQSWRDVRDAGAMVLVLGSIVAFYAALVYGLVKGK